ncbi:hypothetical protein F4777DRAFT_580881 [Nemania sp. FL0916]|nr:hypothetical protein F4777DRAFT_580881 [Nemania sp. FL0916]
MGSMDWEPQFTPVQVLAQLLADLQVDPNQAYHLTNEAPLVPFGPPYPAPTEIDYCKAISNRLLSIALMKGPISKNANRTLDALPDELLLNIVSHLPVPDRIKLAFAYPNLFMNSSRVDIFILDAQEQLRLGTKSAIFVDPNPLLSSVIKGGYSVNSIHLVLDRYEAVSRSRHYDPNTFLNPNFFGFAFGTTLHSPLHAAVEACRLDIVQYLIQRGADPNRAVTGPQPFSTKKMTAFEYALKIRRDKWIEVQSTGVLPDQSIRDDLEDIALELAKHNAFGAFINDPPAIHREMSNAIEEGAECLALFLEDVLVAAANNNVANTPMASRGPALLSQQAPGSNNPPQGLLPNNNMPQPARVRRRQSFTPSYSSSSVGDWSDPGPDVGPAAADYTSRDVHKIATLAQLDTNINEVRQFVSVMIEKHSIAHLQRVLIYAIHAGQDAFQTREWLFANATIAIDGSILRHAVVVRDRRAMTRVVESMVSRGISIDERLPTSDAGAILRGGEPAWLETPLTLALMDRNYIAASVLLAHGADPSRVPTNIRHRVRKVRERVRSGYIDDVQKYIDRGLVPGDGYYAPSRLEYLRAASYVFERVLDDPDNPLPAYPRMRRRPVMPIDHPDNDSDEEDLVTPIVMKFQAAAAEVS